MNRYGTLGIGDITVDKAELISVLETNRANHHKVFEAALEKFREKAIQRLDSMIEVLRSGSIPATLNTSLPIPEEHTEDYDRAIRMFKMSKDDTIKLSEAGYTQLVDDEWGWRHAFDSTNVAYLGYSTGSSANSNYAGAIHIPDDIDPPAQLF